MSWKTRRTAMRTDTIAKFLVSVTLFWSPAVWPANAEDGDLKSPIITGDNAEREMIAALEKMVGIRERQLASLKHLAESGRDEGAAMDDATVELWRAKNRLAEARRQPEALVDGLRQILAIREAAWRRLRLVVDAGRTDLSSLEAARLQVLQARVDLCVLRPLLGELVLREDGLGRALGDASAAVDALIRADD